MSKYLELRKIDVSKHIEKKNNLSYLSWAWAVDVLLQQDPTATWEYKEPQRYGDTLMVFCTVTAFGKSMTAQLPVMNYKNQAIANPDSFAVNTAMQRCLAKAIALHGLGLYIYAGEDLPEDETKVNIHSVTNGQAPKTPLAGALDNFSDAEVQFLRDQSVEMVAAITDNDMQSAHEIWEKLDNEEKTGLWSMLDSKTRSTFKKYQESLKQKEAA